jgi:hypothetical protein
LILNISNNNEKCKNVCYWYGYITVFFVIWSVLLSWCLVSSNLLVQHKVVCYPCISLFKSVCAVPLQNFQLWGKRIDAVDAMSSSHIYVCNSSIQIAVETSDTLLFAPVATCVSFWNEPSAGLCTKSHTEGFCEIWKVLRALFFFHSVVV